LIRWKYLAPRLVILILVCLAVMVGSRPLLRLALIHSIQSVTGGKVDIAHVDYSLWEGKLELAEIECADPRRPMRNLLQADQATIQLDPRCLSHREFVVTEARLDDLQFGTPRTLSGQLVPGLSKTPEADEPPAIRIARSQLESIGSSWMNQLAIRAPKMLDEEFRSLQLADQISQKWPREFQKLQTRSTRIQAEIAQLQATAKSLGDNSLRDIDKSRSLIAGIESLKQEIEQTRQKLHGLSREFANDRQRVEDACQADQQKLAERLQRDQLVDQQEISELLLGEMTAGQLEEILGWVSWFREAVPDPEEDFYPLRDRGQDIQFRQRPKLLVKRVHLDGRGKMAGRTLRFFGDAFDISSQPKLHDRPTRIKLRGQADTEVALSATLDRRGPQRIDRFQVTCPNLPIPETRLGRESEIEVLLQNAHLAIDIDLQLMDDQLAGQMVFHQSAVQLEVTHLSDLVGGAQTAAVLNQNLKSLQSFQIAVDVSGSIQSPQMSFTSDLGEQFATAINHASQQLMQQQMARQSEKLQRLVDERLMRISQDFSTRAAELVGQLNREVPVVSQIENRLPELKLWKTIR